MTKIIDRAHWARSIINLSSRMDYFVLRFRRQEQAKSPATPMPSNESVPGSGMAVFAQTIVCSLPAESHALPMTLPCSSIDVAFEPT